MVTVTPELQQASDRLDAARRVLAALEQATKAAKDTERDLSFEFNRAMRAAREAGNEPYPMPPSLLDQAFGEQYVANLEALIKGPFKSRFEK